MENKKIDHKERVNYVTEHHEDGRTSYTGVSVNYGGVCSSWESVEDLERKQKALIHMWCDMGKRMADKDLEMHEMTIEEWEGKDDNIDYWEIERIKRLLKRPTIQERFVDIIADDILDWRHNEEVSSDDIAKLIIEHLINQINN